MSCNNCNTNHPSESCPDIFRFTLDGTYLIPRCGNTPLPPLNLDSAVKEAETDTRLQLDVSERALVYTGEQASNNNSSADTISIPSIASLIDLNEIRDVEYPFASDGDLLQWDSTSSRWVSYTVPEGTIETPVGVDENGKLVKSGSAPDPGSSDTIPLGGMIVWPGPINAIPVGFRECNGQTVSRSVYASLFTIIGTMYGAGDGSTTFNLPDLRTRTVRGYHSGDTQFDVIGETGGAKRVTISWNEMPPHGHTGNTSAAGNHQHDASASGHSGLVNYLPGGNGNLNIQPGGNNRGVGALTSANGNHSHSFSTNNAGGGQSHENLGPYVAMPYVMRVI